MNIYRMLRLYNQDAGGGSGGTANTADTSNTTGGATGNSAQDANAGGATDASQTSQDNTQTASADNTDPQLKAALELLAAKGYKPLTDKQFNGHMAQARRSGETDAENKAKQAQQQAEEQQRIANGQAAEVAKEQRTTIDTLQADVKAKDETIERLSKHVNAQIDAAIQNVPAVLREFDPGAERLADRMEWYEKLLKHPEVVNGGGFRPGTGYVPSPGGNSGQSLAQQHINRTYAQPQQQGQQNR